MYHKSKYKKRSKFFSINVILFNTVVIEMDFFRTKHNIFDIIFVTKRVGEHYRSKVTSYRGPSDCAMSLRVTNCV